MADCVVQVGWIHDRAPGVAQVDAAVVQVHVEAENLQAAEGGWFLSR